MRNIYQEKLESFYGQNKRMPTYSEMMKLFSFKSKNAVFRVVEKLIEAGMVAKDHLGRLSTDSSLRRSADAWSGDCRLTCNSRRRTS